MAILLSTNIAQCDDCARPRGVTTARLSVGLGLVEILSSMRHCLYLMGVWTVSTFSIRLFILVALQHLCFWAGGSNWAVYGCHCSYSRSPGVSFFKISKLNESADAKSGAEWTQCSANPCFTTCVCANEICPNIKMYPCINYAMNE